MQSRIVRSSNVTALEGVSYALVAVIVIAGFILATVNPDFFHNYYVIEDGVLEYFTAFALFVIAVICFLRLTRERQYHTKAFIVTHLLIFVLMIFGAGEEISWGQRIFNVESGEFFQSNNRQSETNLHNMEVKGVNINKLIFGQLMALFLVSLYLILPTLYRRSAWVRNIFDRLYIPVPKIHLGIALLVTGIAISLIPSSKRAELNEVCLAIFFVLTIVAPQNRFVASDP